MLIACSKVWVVLRNCKVTSSLKPGRSAGLFHWQIKRPTRCVPEPPPNSQHAPVLRNPPRPFDKLRTTPPRRGAAHIPSRARNPPRPTATPPRRGAERIPSRARNPPRPTATPPRRGVFPIPSLEGCRVSGGVGCPQPGPLRQAQDHPLRLGSGQASKEGSSTHPLSILAIEKTSGISYYARLTCI